MKERGRKASHSIVSHHSATVSSSRGHLPHVEIAMVAVHFETHTHEFTDWSRAALYLVAAHCLPLARTVQRMHQTNQRWSIIPPIKVSENLKRPKAQGEKRRACNARACSHW